MGPAVTLIEARTPTTDLPALCGCSRAPALPVFSGIARTIDRPPYAVIVTGWPDCEVRPHRVT